MTIQFFGHPFSSYTQKVLIALWANDTPIDYRMVEDPDNMAELRKHSPFGQFPLILDGDRAVFETSIIIEYLQDHHPGPHRLIPDDDEGLRVRFFDRFFDLYVMTNMQNPVANKLRPDGKADAYGEAKARERLHIAYDWLEQSIGDGWAVGENFTMADCAAAPSLFYADWVEPIGDKRPRLKTYRERLLADPVVARAVNKGRPFRHYFPLGAPDRD